MTLPEQLSLLDLEPAVLTWRDDSQVVSQGASKSYGEPARVEVTVDRIHKLKAVA